MSLSLPFNIQNLPIKGDKVLNYFDNLLPDSEAIRKRVAERFKTGSTPTTHILKLPLGLMGGQQADFTTSVDNEWLCMSLLKAYGLPVANVAIETFGTQRVLVVERFDRKIASNGEWIMRLPQEDFCQVTGAPSILKYESDGGPGLKVLFNTLRQSENSAADLRTLMTSQVLFWMLCAPDGFSSHVAQTVLGGLEKAAGKLASPLR